MIDREFDDLPEAARKDLPHPKEVYGVESSATCPNGTRGRIAVFEMLATSKELEGAILEKPTEDELYKVARAQGMFTMKDDAIVKMLDGVIYPLKK